MNKKNMFWVVLFSIFCQSCLNLHSEVSIILSMEKDLDERISVVQTGKLQLLHHTFMSNELKKEIN